ncbi:site-specific tyrosine recombinase/integron integrase [Halocola ammonii]
MPLTENQPTNEKSIVLKRFFHRGAKHIGLFFDYDNELITIAKSLNAKWTRTHRCWYLPEEESTTHKIINAFRGTVFVDAKALYGGREPVIKKQEEPPKPKRKRHSFSDVSLPEGYLEMLKHVNYSQNTIDTYCSYFRRFIAHFTPLIPEEISDREIVKYVGEISEKNKYSNSTRGQIISAIKFYYEKVLKQDKKLFDLPRQRKEDKLPQVLNEQEVEQLISAIDNLKHRTIVCLIYSTGIRRSESVNLRISDLDIPNKRIYIRGAKGRKDRISILSNTLINILHKYFEVYKPNYWLFEGQGRKKYSAGSVGKVVKGAGKKAGLQVDVTPHVLRHSFATHLMDRGVDTRIIQRLLGHKSLNTTAIYTHVSNKNFANITNPLDNLYGDKQLIYNKHKNKQP